MYSYKVQEIIEVIDGDTVDTKIDLGFGLSARIRVRVYGIDTPEIFGKNKSEVGVQAHEFTKLWLEENKDSLILYTYKGSENSTGIGDGSFGRWLGSFVSTNTDVTLSEALIAAGLVK